MKSSSDSMLPVVVAGVARSDTLLFSETETLSPPVAAEAGSLLLSSCLSVLRTLLLLLLLLLLLELCCPALDVSVARVAALPPFSIAASTAFLFLV